MAIEGGAARGRRAQKPCPCPRLLNLNPFGVPSRVYSLQETALLENQGVNADDYSILRMLRQ
jgi:hypothetical protein